MTDLNLGPDHRPSELAIRVYYEDTDAGGIVYHASYLRFMERARTEWLRAHDVNQTSMRERGEGLFVVRNLAIQYRQPAALDDLLTVHTTVESVGRASVTFRQEVLRTNELLCDAAVTVCHVDVVTRRPIALTNTLRTLFTQARN